MCVRFRLRTYLHSDVAAYRARCLIRVLADSNLLVAGYLHNVELGFTTAGDLVCARKTVAGQQYTVPVHFTKGVPPATAFELDSICTDKTSLANCPQ